MNHISSFRFLYVPAVLLAIFTTHISGAPTNDNFSASVQLSGTNITYSGDLSGATFELNEPVSDGTNTVWVSWTAPESGTVTAKLPSFSFDWAVFTGPAVSNLMQVPVVPYYSNSLSRFWAFEGVVYHFQFSGSVGGFTFSFQSQPEGVCVNDDFADAELVMGNGPYVATSPVGGATMELGEPAHMGNVPQKSVWWKWQSPHNGTALFTPNAALVTNLVLTAYAGDSVEALTPLGKSTNSEVRFPVTGGRFYYVAGAVPTNSPGDIRGYFHRGDFDNVSRAVPGNCLLEPSWEESL
jgi:hypothetical protein